MSGSRKAASSSGDARRNSSCPQNRIPSAGKRTRNYVNEILIMPVLLTMERPEASAISSIISVNRAADSADSLGQTEGA